MGSNPSLLARRDAFERVRKYWAAKTGTWCAVDFEDWERDHSVITEFGFSSIKWKNGMEVEDCGHFTVKEHAMYTNSQYVPDNRTVGDTVTIPHTFNETLTALPFW
jgi:hypothetical protein